MTPACATHVQPTAPLRDTDKTPNARAFSSTSDRDSSRGVRPRARAYYRATATTTRGSIARAVAAHDDAGGVRRAEVRARCARGVCSRVSTTTTTTTTTGDARVTATVASVVAVASSVVGGRRSRAANVIVRGENLGEALARLNVYPETDDDYGRIDDAARRERTTRGVLKRERR
jgi:hypothetical protein